MNPVPDDKEPYIVICPNTFRQKIYFHGEYLYLDEMAFKLLAMDNKDDSAHDNDPDLKDLWEEYVLLRKLKLGR